MRKGIDGFYPLPLSRDGYVRRDVKFVVIFASMSAQTLSDGRYRILIAGCVNDLIEI